MEREWKRFWSYFIKEFKHEDYFDNSDYSLFIENHRKGRVLDLGAGLGSHTIYYANKGFKVTSVEIESFHIINTTKRIKELKICDLDNIQFVNKDILNFKPEKEGYSVVLLNNILHFFEKSDCQNVINMVDTALENRGICFIQAHHIDHPSNTLKEDYFKQFFSEKTLMEYFENTNHNYNILKSEYSKSIMPTKLYRKWQKTYAKFGTKLSEKDFCKMTNHVSLVIQKNGKKTKNQFPKVEFGFSLKNKPK